MSQPKLPPDLAGDIATLGFVASCYQPIGMFKPGKRTLPNVPNPDDPWQVFFRRPDEIGVVVTAYGHTLREAINQAISQRPGLSGAMERLDTALGDLTETLRCL